MITNKKEKIAGYIYFILIVSLLSVLFFTSNKTNITGNLTLDAGKVISSFGLLHFNLILTGFLSVLAIGMFIIRYVQE